MMKYILSLLALTELSACAPKSSIDWAEIHNMSYRTSTDVTYVGQGIIAASK